MFHPTACLIVWIVFAGCTQVAGGTALAVSVPFILMCGAAVAGRWLRQLWRAKWLFASLWIILAYGIPGDLVMGFEWAPSVDGVMSASLHAARLAVLLGSIAALFAILSQPRFIAGLWGAAAWLRYCGISPDRTIARLALVFDYLDRAPKRGSWRHFVDWPEDAGEESRTVLIEDPRWRPRDAALLAFAAVMAFSLLVL